MELSNQREGISLMFIGAALGFLTQILASHQTLLWVLCIGFLVSGVIVLIWPYLRNETDLTIILRLRDQVQRLLDEIGEEPKLEYRSTDMEWQLQMENWKKHKLQLVHKFRRRLLPKIQDLIHRLGEQGRTDDPLNLMIDNDPQDYAAIKELADRLSLMASRDRQQKGTR